MVHVICYVLSVRIRQKTVHACTLRTLYLSIACARLFANQTASLPLQLLGANHFTVQLLLKTHTYKYVQRRQAVKKSLGGLQSLTKPWRNCCFSHLKNEKLTGNLFSLFPFTMLCNMQKTMPSIAA